MSVFAMPRTTQQEQFSIAFVHSIVSTAGFGIERISIDVDSIDVTIHQYGKDDEYPIIETLNVQLKCTYAHPPKSDNLIHFPLKLKNYNDLRRVCMSPRILVIVHVPENPLHWLAENPNNLSLFHAAYWISLRNQPAINTDSITVKVPTDSKFSTSELKRIMSLLAQGQYL